MNIAPPIKHCQKTKLRQHRTKIVRQKRSQIFCQIVQKFCRHTIVCQEISAQDDEKERPKEVPLGYKFMTCKVFRRALCGVALKIKFIKDDDEGILPYFKEEDAEKLDF